MKTVCSEINAVNSHKNAPLAPPQDLIDGCEPVKVDDLNDEFFNSMSMSDKVRIVKLMNDFDDHANCLWILDSAAVSITGNCTGVLNLKSNNDYQLRYAGGGTGSSRLENHVHKL